MKKKLFLGLLAAAAVSFTACQKDEVISEMPQDNAISFNTYLGRGAQTKGTVIETDDLEDLGFGVFAYYTGTTAASAYTFPATPNFMNNEKVYKYDWDDDNTTDYTWGYSNTKYWPYSASDKISFYAYGPYDDPEGASNAISITTAATKKPKLTYTVSTDISEHMDVLFAPAQENITKEIEDGTVTFEFQHALSRIHFSIKTSADYSGKATLTLNSVTLTGPFVQSAWFSLGESELEWEDRTQIVTYNFTIDESSKGDTDKKITNAKRTVEATKNSPEYIMIIPQEIAAGNELKITVNYTVSYTEGATITNEVTKNINPTSRFEFVAGKAYEFAISVGLNEVKFSAEVSGWGDPTETTVNVL